MRLKLFGLNKKNWDDHISYINLDKLFKCIHKLKYAFAANFINQISSEGFPTINATYISRAKGAC